VLVLLPPSEGKSVPAAGDPVDLEGLSLPALTPAREQVLSALVDLCSADPARAADVLGLPPSLSGEVDRDARLLRAPAAAAGRVYSGVLFAALGGPDADARARRRLEEWALVWSGLWGAVRLTDHIPAYRLSGAVSLPGVGRLTRFWRDPLAGALADLAAEQVVLDLRSGTYAATWTPPAGTSVVGRVVQERAGRRTVASHANKATKGRLMRSLAEGRAEPRTVAELVDAIHAAGFRAELADPAARGGRSGGSRPAVLDIVVDSL
jgi:cytoplasmic iron level regulating protein YaaA (DUF328/UPF0246 family)